MFIPYKDVNNSFLIIKYKYKKELNQLLENYKQAKWNASLNEFTFDSKIKNIIDCIKYASPKLNIQLHKKLEIYDLRYIQELLGHNSSKTTEIYTHVSNKHLHQIKSQLDDLNF